MFGKYKVSDDLLFLGLMCVLALAVRLHLLFASGFVVDGDEAIVGLMGKHILEGRGVPVFYYGQHYMGSFEAICAAFFFKIFGVSAVVLKLVPLMFSIMLLFAVYALCIEISGRATARLATLFLALPPTGLVEWSSKARGGFIEILVLGALALLFAIRFFRVEWKSRESIASLLLCSFLLGFGWWINNQIVYFIIPVGLLCIVWAFLEGSLSAAFHAACLGLAAFFIGGAPYWLYNFSHDFISFEMFHSAGSGGFIKHCAGFFTSALPILFGARRFWHEMDLFPGSTIVSYLVYGTFLAVFLLSLVRKMGQADQMWFWFIFPLTFFAGSFIFIGSSFGHLVQAPRYLLPMYVVLMPFAAYVIAEVMTERFFYQVFFTMTVLFLNLSSTYLGGLSIPGEPHVFNGERVSRDHGELISWLAEHDIHHVRTNYWIGYKLAFETNEKVRFSMFQDPHKVRLQEYELLGKQTGETLRLPIVAVPSQGALLRDGLALLQIPYQYITLSGYEVFYDIQAPNRSLLKEISRHEYAVSTNTHPQDILNVVDGDTETRWGTGAPQSPGMKVDVDLKKPMEVRQALFDLGKFSTDFPRKLEVDAEDDRGQHRIVCNSEDLRKMLYFLSEEDEQTILLPPGPYKKLSFIQVGKDPFFDWSIAELKLFSY